MNSWTRWLNRASYALLAAVIVGKQFGEYISFFDLFSHYAVQYVAVGTLLTALALWLRFGRKQRANVWLPLLSTAIATFWTVSSLNATSGTNVAGPPDFRVLHANILYTNPDVIGIETLVQSQQPDVLVLQEITPAHIRALMPRLRAWPHWVAHWSKGPCWTLVASRQPLRVEPGPLRNKRVFVVRTTVRDRRKTLRPVTLLTVHPRTPLLPAWYRERNDQLRYAAERAGQEQNPAVLVGDFNITPFATLFRDIFLKSNLTPCRTGWQPTWPRWVPVLYLPLDHAFTNAGLQTTTFQTLDNPGSDHRAVVADVAFSPNKSR